MLQELEAVDWLTLGVAVPTVPCLTQCFQRISLFAVLGRDLMTETDSELGSYCQQHGKEEASSGTVVS